MPKTKIAAILAGLVVSLCHDRVQAQTFGQQGDVSFAAERLMGLYIVDADGRDSDFALGFGGPPPCCFGPFNSPRLGIDGFIIDSLSLGGSLVVGHDADPDNTWFLVAPRVGYAIGIGRSFGFWPRGGLTLWNGNGNDDGGVALTGEALFYGTPDQWGFLFGPTLDFQVDDPHWHALGLMTAGVFGWL
jgi:hypothetical protein